MTCHFQRLSSWRSAVSTGQRTCFFRYCKPRLSVSAIDIHGRALICHTCLAPPTRCRNAIHLVRHAVTWKMNTDTLHRMLASKSRRTMRGRVYRPSGDTCTPPPTPRGEEPTPGRNVAPNFLVAKAKHATDSRHPTYFLYERKESGKTGERTIKCTFRSCRFRLCQVIGETS